MTDETTGQQATSFWDPATGKGTIDTPNDHPRPATYAVAAVCLRLKTLDEINPDEVAQALQNVDPSAGPDAVGQALLLPSSTKSRGLPGRRCIACSVTTASRAAGPSAAEAVTAEPAFIG